MRDDRPFGGTAPPAAVFHYSRSRHGDYPREHLAGYGGIMQADAFTGYNAAERALCGIAIGRRNWTFCGSDAGGHRAAIYTLIETANSPPASPTGFACRSLKPAPLNDVDPQTWLADVLARLPDHPAKRIKELLPWNWKAARAVEAFAKAA